MEDGHRTDPRWGDAVTLSQLGELIADWLEGRIRVPIYGGGPDTETEALVPVLAHLNRSGFVTETSQPGQLDGDWAQRAVVSGYCDQEVAERLASISVRGDLIVISQPAGTDATFQLPVTRTNNLTFTIICGDYATSRPNDDLWPWPDLPPTMRAVLRGTWHVAICDPVWGRNDVLWPALTAAMGHSPEEVRGSLSDNEYIEAQEGAG